MKIAPEDKVLIGLILKPHGVKGEVKVKPITDFPERFLQLKRAFLVSGSGAQKEITIEKAKVLRGMVLLKIREIDSISEAEKYRGSEIVIMPEDKIELPPDYYFESDLIGMQVVLSHGQEIGTIVDVQSYPAQDMLIVKTVSGGEIMLPFVKEIVPEVLPEDRKVIVNNISGLIDEE